MNYFYKADSSGRLIETMTCATDNDNQFLLAGYTKCRFKPSYETHYEENGKLCQRPEMPARLLGGHIIGIPVPAAIRINNKEYACADPIASLDFTYPGTYKITVSSWPYLDAKFEVTR